MGNSLRPKQLLDIHRCCDRVIHHHCILLDATCWTLSLCQTMELDIRRAVLHDASAIVEIQVANPFELTRAMDPNGMSGDAKEHLLQGVLQDIDDTASSLATVATTSSGQVVGYAKWRLFLRDEESISKEPTRKNVEASNNDVIYRFQQGLHAGRLEHTVGEAHIRLSNLFTHPDYHRKGVGSALLSHGLRIADERGLFTFLEASPAGAPLYKRHSFQEVGHFDVELDSGTYRTLLMHRPRPAAESGESNGSGKGNGQARQQSDMAVD